MIESGRRNDAKFIRIPATFFKVIEKGRAIVSRVRELSEAVNGRPSVVIQGNVVGGGSTVNAMLYVRGQAEEYDGWAQNGNRGWVYSNVLPVFRDLESNIEHSGQFHGTEGEPYVSETGFHHPLSRASIRAAQEAEIPYNPDFNGCAHNRGRVLPDNHPQWSTLVIGGCVLTKS